MRENRNKLAATEEILLMLTICVKKKEMFFVSVVFSLPYCFVCSLSLTLIWCVHMHVIYYAPLLRIRLINADRPDRPDRHSRARQF
jgi:hypothetical protein